MTDLTRTNIQNMLRARRVAVIGASERNPFSAPVIRNFDRFGFTGEVLLVNPRGEPIHGRPTLRTVGELDGPIDAAFVCVAAEAVLNVVDEAADAGVTGFVIVSSGFAEIGGGGLERQKQLSRLARDRGIALYGPNSLGFINYVDQIPLSVIELDNARGSLGIVSASGSVGGFLAKAAQLQRVGLSHMILAGNEAGTTIADTIDVLVDDPDTRAIAVFLETIYDPERFAAAAERALRAQKPIIVLKAGAAEATAHLAAAHTGALVGDDRVFNAVAKELGVIRVDSYEDVIATATLLSATGPIKAPGIAALTVSGGSAELLSDLAESAAVSFPPFSPATRTELDKIVSAFGASHNPVDVTGAALADPGLWERILRTIAQDDRIGLALCLWDAPHDGDAPWQVETLESIVRGYAAFNRQPPLVMPVAQDLSAAGMDALASRGIPGMLLGLKPTVTALSRLVAWSQRVNDPRPVGLFAAATSAGEDGRPTGERALLDWLGNRGIPVTPGWRAADADAAIVYANSCGYPVVLKLDSPDIQHKSEVGGVQLNVRDETAVRAAFAAICSGCPSEARFEGVIVSPMRTPDVELIVAISRDPIWGSMLSIGLGGIWVEIFKDTIILPLPSCSEQIVAALKQLKSAPLLAGARGRRPADLAMLADVIMKIADAALELGPDLSALELNPVAVWPDHAEAMDAVALWAADDRR